VHRHVVSMTSVPGNLQDFLLVDSNKTNLFLMLFFDSFASNDKQLVITDGELILCKPLLTDFVSIPPYTNEEADTLTYTLHSTHGF